MKLAKTEENTGHLNWIQAALDINKQSFSTLVILWI
jgi:hypothetical protein